MDWSTLLSDENIYQQCDRDLFENRFSLFAVPRPVCPSVDMRPFRGDGTGLSERRYIDTAECGNDGGVSLKTCKSCMPPPIKVIDYQKEIFI
jgi:hypothetical protein